MGWFSKQSNTTKGTINFNQNFGIITRFYAVFKALRTFTAPHSWLVGLNMYVCELNWCFRSLRHFSPTPALFDIFSFLNPSIYTLVMIIIKHKLYNRKYCLKKSTFDE